MTPATLVIHNARIYTCDAAQPWAQAIAVAGDRIAWVGANADARAWIDSRTEVIDAAGRLLLPGLIDSHLHLLLGARSLDALLFDGTETLAVCQKRVRDYAAANPHRAWITGQGWQYRLFPPGTPINRALLDAAVPDRPVYLIAFDGHTAWVNTLALERAGILHGAQTGANSFVVMGDDGLATGELREADAIDYVRRILPQFTPEDDERLVRRALAGAAALGLTSVHNMDGNEYQLGLYTTLAERGEMTLRVRFPMSVTPRTSLAELESFAAVGAQHDGPWVRGGCVKLFMDGVIESKTALMLQPYADGSGDLGAANYEQAHFEQLVTRADALCQQVIVHAIGDGAVRRTLDAYEAAQRANGRRDARHRVEHVEVLDPADLPRFNQIGAVAAMQPLHADFGYDPDNPWRRLVGPERWAWGFPWQTLRSAGVPLALGSDWPVVGHDPLRGIHTALNRIKLDFSAPDSAFPDQRLSLEEAIAGYTYDAAYVGFQEHEAGRLRAGLLADMVLLSDDLFALPREAINTARVVLTVSGGQVVYSL